MKEVHIFTHVDFQLTYDRDMKCSLPQALYFVICVLAKGKVDTAIDPAGIRLSVTLDKLSPFKMYPTLSVL